MRNYIRQCQNEDGFTLIELLASIALFTLVTTLGMTLFLGAQGSQKSVEADLSLQRQANNTVMELRKEHAEQLSTNHSSIALPLTLTEGIEIKRLVVNGINQSDQPVITGFERTDDIHIDLTIQTSGTAAEDDHRETHIQTVLYGDAPKTITLNNN